MTDPDDVTDKILGKLMGGPLPKKKRALKDSPFTSPGLQMVLNSEDPKHKELQSRLQNRVVDVANELRKEKPGPERLKSIYDSIDACTEAALNQGTKVSCTAGCSFCCHTPVTVTQEELENLVQIVEDRELPIDLMRLKKQAKHAEDFDEFWAQGPVNATKCVFLDNEGKCGIYEDRPAACRTHFVSSDPKYCRVDETAEQGDHKKFVVPTAEVVATAAMQLQKIGYLHEGLYKAITGVEDIK